MIRYAEAIKPINMEGLGGHPAEAAGGETNWLSSNGSRRLNDDGKVFFSFFQRPMIEEDAGLSHHARFALSGRRNFASL